MGRWKISRLRPTPSLTSPPSALGNPPDLEAELLEEEWRVILANRGMPHCLRLMATTRPQNEQSLYFCICWNKALKENSSGNKTVLQRKGQALATAANLSLSFELCFELWKTWRRSTCHLVLCRILTFVPDHYQMDVPRFCHHYNAPYQPPLQLSALFSSYLMHCSPLWPFLNQLGVGI